MSQLVHAKCGGNVIAKMSIELRVLSFSINGKDLIPGAVEARVEKESSETSVAWGCSKCGEVFPSRDSLEKSVVIKCPLCNQLHPVGESVSTAYTPFIGRECLEKVSERNPAIPKACHKYSVLDVISRMAISI